MMFSDEEIKESSLMRPGDEIISIQEVCLIDKYDKKYLGSESLLSHSSRNELEVPRLFRDGLFSEGLDPQARFAWTEEDGNITSLISEPGFGTTGTTFGKDLDVALNSNMKEHTSNSEFEISRTRITIQSKSQVETNVVSSTSIASTKNVPIYQPKGRTVHKVDKADPRSRNHYVKYVKRNGRTVKLWECGICSREFQHQYTLMRHLPTHTDERNFHCDVCSKSFRQLSTLSQHRAIHSAERPYACEVCNKTFNRVSTLISHRKTHSDEKPYMCHMCPKGFHQKGNLRNHLFTHTNERPYRCDVCRKGFNQQSNLVCHKNKAHPDDNNANCAKSRTISQVPVVSTTKTDINKTRSPSQQCEVTSSVGPYMPISEDSIPLWHKPTQWDTIKSDLITGDLWNESPWGSHGVIVDPIKTYHMGVALATRQTPFALLKSDSGTPVLVKIIDTNLPGGKQMLVPATADDLKIGGKIVLNNEEVSNETQAEERQDLALPSTAEENSAVQIRVPVVATVVPKIRPGGKLQLSVEEPHHVYPAALPSTDDVPTSLPKVSCKSTVPSLPTTSTLPPLKPMQCHDFNTFSEQNLQAGCSSSPSPSSPFDLISLDLFEPIGCIPLGPQITSVDNIENRPPSEDSDIFIEKFEEIIPLSDSD